MNFALYSRRLAGGCGTECGCGRGNGSRAAGPVQELRIDCGRRPNPGKAKARAIVIIPRAAHHAVSAFAKVKSENSGRMFARSAAVSDTAKAGHIDHCKPLDI